MLGGILVRRMSSSPAMAEVVVMGGGLMGTGIAQIASQTQHKVTLVDLNEGVLAKSEKRIVDSLKRVSKKMFKDDLAAGENFVSKSAGNISYVTNSENSLGSADIVVEAISEVLPLKQKLFKQWDQVCPEKTIFATNTSFLRVNDVMADVGRKDKCGGLHFFNPVPVMKLVEVVRTGETSDETYNKLMTFSKDIGKHPVTCRDTEGFIVNRLLGPYIGDAIAMVERGDATYQDVDIAVKLGLGYPMGPFELLDYTGIDLHKHINDNPEFPLRRPSKLIDQMVSEGKFGMKSGEGFYKYNKK